MKKVNVMLVFIAALLLSCTTAFADGGVVHVLLNTDTEYTRVLSSVSQVSPSNLGDFALELYYDEGNCFSGPTNTDYPIDVRGVEVRLYSDKYVLEVVDQYGDRHFVGYYVGDNFHIYWSDSHPGDVFIDEDASFSEQIARTLEGIARQVSRIDQALTSEDGPFALWMSLLDTDLDLVNINLEQISLKVQSVVDYTNVIANGTVTLVEKMDELIEAVNGISISADGATINFDMLPITNKLDEVITAVNGISVNVESGTFDTLPITNKLDEVITAINGISINVEGGTVNFDTVPITDKLDEVIDALHDISVEGAFCDHTFVDSGQYTYQTILPLTRYDLTNRIVSAEQDDHGWYEVDLLELVEGETYQVNFDGEIRNLVARVTNNGLNKMIYLGNHVDTDHESYDIPYPYSIKYHVKAALGGGVESALLKVDPVYDKDFDLSISRQVSIRYCSKCGTTENGSNLLLLIGTINHAASSIHHAIRGYDAGISSVSVDLTELMATLTDNHDDLTAGLGSFFEWVATESLIAPCEHSYMPVVMVEPSCDFPGVTKFTCEYCGTFRVELSESLGHEWMDFTPPEPVVLLEDAPFGLIDGSSPPMLGNYQLITLVPGEMYTVIYNGTEYVTECVSAEFNGLTVPAIGNVEAFYGTGNNGLPFIITSAEVLGGSGCIDLSGATFARISIYTVPEETEDVPEYLQSLLVCSRCDNGHNLAGVMEFLDERLVPGSGGGSDLTPVLTRMDTIIESLGADLGAAGCEHVYVAEVNQEQTCVLPGLQTHTCELCGSSYSEILESLGHDWQCTEHVEDELDPETGEVISSGYDIYTCSICDDTYNDYDGNGAPEDGSTSITGIVSRVFEKIGSLVGELLAMSVRLLDKLLTGFDEIVTSFNEKTQQIVSFGSGYTTWLSGFWGIVPSDLQLALSFCVVVICLGIIGKKVVFAS